MKLRYWYKTDHNKQPIPGSNIRRKSRPGASHQWKEILNPCCSTLDTDCTCGSRYFVQLDGRGNPVDGSLIKRIRGDKPEGTEGMKFYELQWKSPCCATIGWYLGITDSTGSLVIEVNGNEIINSIINDTSGSFKPNFGDLIEITLTNTGDSPITNFLNVTGGHTFLDTTNPVTTYSFIWTGKETYINTVITGTSE